VGRVIIAVGGTEEEEEGASSVGGKCGTAVYPQHGVPLPRANGLQPPHLSYERWGDAKKPFLMLQAAFTRTSPQYSLQSLLDVAQPTPTPRAR